MIGRLGDRMVCAAACRRMIQALDSGWVDRYLQMQSAAIRMSFAMMSTVAWYGAGGRAPAPRR